MADTGHRAENEPTTELVKNEEPSRWTRITYREAVNQSWTEIVAVALATSLVTFISGLIVNLVSDQMKPRSKLFLAFSGVATVILTTVVVAYPQARDRIFGGDSPDTSTTSTSSSSSKPSPPEKAQSTSTPKRHPSRTPSPSKSTAPKIRGYIASARSSTASEADNRPPAKIRFWAYEGADVIGSVRFSTGGYAGRFGWAPTAIGKDCAVPYVRFIFGGIKTGKYDVLIHTPDVPNLAHQVDISDQTIDQSAHRGEWFRLSQEKITADSTGTSYELSMNQSPASFGDNHGCRRGAERVAFDAVWLRPLA